YKIVNEDNSLLFNYIVPPKEPVVYITNIISIIERDYNAGYLYDIMDKSEFGEIYNKFKEEFISLTEDDLEFVIKLILLQTSGVVYKHFQEDVQQYIMTIVSAQKAKEKEYKIIETNLHDFYNYATEIKDYSDYLEYIKPKNEERLKFTFNTVAFNIKG